MRNPFGYKVLRTYQQGQEIYILTKKFTASHLQPFQDSRLIAHFNDSGRSIPTNIAEGYGRNNTKQYYEFLGFSFGSLVELIEDLLRVETEIKGGQRKTKDDEAALIEIGQLIKLCMGEKTMLKSQMDGVEKMVGEQGLLPERQRVAKAVEQNRQRERELDKWIQEQRQRGATKDGKG